MKNLIKLSLALICLCSFYSTHAQEKGEINVSAGFSGMHIDNSLGLALGAEYIYAKRFSVAAGLLYASAGSTNPVRFESLLSLDFRYYFFNKGVSAYVFSGYGLHEAQGLDSFNDGNRSLHSAMLGAGAEYEISEKLNVYLQSKGWYNERGGYQTFNLGVVFRLRKK